VREREREGGEREESPKIFSLIFTSNCINGNGERGEPNAKRMLFKALRERG
jgi:hypothetical protein